MSWVAHGVTVTFHTNYIMSVNKPFVKKATIPRVCKNCGITFLAKDAKTSLCPTCWVSVRTCECGKPKQYNALYCAECRNTKYSHTRGKTYEDIMGVEKAKQLRDQKIFSFKSAAKAAGEYRSLYEKDFADFLLEHRIPFEYEVKLQGIEKTWSKLVDFFLPNQGLYIELSGYIWASERVELQERFLNRILEIATMLPSYQFAVATEPVLLPRIQSYFDGYTPYNGKPLLILSMYELRQHILSIGETNEDNKGAAT